MNADDRLELKERRLNNKEDDLLEMLLNKEKNWEKRLVTAKYAYHVTNVPEADAKPTFPELKWHLANDLKYDRHIVGLPCVFFTTTKLKDDNIWELLDKDELPDTSPYPARSKKGEKHWRVCVPLDTLKKYDMWYCKHPAKGINNKGESIYQVRLILTKDIGERKYVENIPDIIELKKEEKNPFLYYDNKDGNWYTNDYSTDNISNLKINYFVNFVVLKNVSLKGIGGVKWDTVARSGVGPGEPLNSELLAAAVIRNWSAYRKSQNPIEQITAGASNVKLSG